MEASGQDRQSVFVTVVAWVFIVISGFATFVSIGQNVMIWTHPGFRELAATAGSSTGFEGLLHRNFRLVVLGFLGITILMLASSIGLLKRKNWARISMIALLAFWVIWNVVSLVIVFFFATEDVQRAADQVQGAHLFTQLFMLIFLGTIAALLVWIIRRLLAPEVAIEFTG